MEECEAVCVIVYAAGTVGSLAKVTGQMARQTPLFKDRLERSLPIVLSRGGNGAVVLVAG